MEGLKQFSLLSPASLAARQRLRVSERCSLLSTLHASSWLSWLGGCLLPDIAQLGASQCTIGVGPAGAGGRGAGGGGGGGGHDTLSADVGVRTFLYLLPVMDSRWNSLCKHSLMCQQQLPLGCCFSLRWRIKVNGLTHSRHSVLTRVIGT